MPIVIGHWGSSHQLRLARFDIEQRIPGLDRTPRLATDAADYATAAQGALADTAVQPADLESVATSGAAADVSITDAGSYYTSADVEGALQEVGGMIGDIATALDLINGEVI